MNQDTHPAEARLGMCPCGHHSRIHNASGCTREKNIGPDHWVSGCDCKRSYAELTRSQAVPVSEDGDTAIGVLAAEITRAFIFDSTSGVKNLLRVHRDRIAETLRSRSVPPSEGEREALARATDDEIEMWARRDLQGDPAGGFRAQALLYSGRVEGAKWMRDLLRSRAAESASISDESVSAAQRVLAERYGYPLSAAAVMDALLAAQAAGSASSALPDGDREALARTILDLKFYKVTPKIAGLIADAAIVWFRSRAAGSASSALPEGVTLEVVAEAIKACAVAAHRLGAIGDALDRAFEATATEEAPRGE
jgi:hypothetical protein